MSVLLGLLGLFHPVQQEEGVGSPKRVALGVLGQGPLEKVVYEMQHLDDELVLLRVESGQPRCSLVLEVGGTVQPLT